MTDTDAHMAALLRRFYNATPPQSPPVERIPHAWTCRDGKLVPAPRPRGEIVTATPKG